MTTATIYDAAHRKYRPKTTADRLRCAGFRSAGAERMAPLIDTAATLDSGGTKDTIAEAEAAVTKSPLCYHGFARAESVIFANGVVRHALTRGDAADYDEVAAVRTATIAAAKDRGNAAVMAVRTAGYTFDPTSNFWVKAGFRCQIHGYDWAEITVNVYADGMPMAFSATPEYPEESLEYGR